MTAAVGTSTARCMYRARAPNGSFLPDRQAGLPGGALQSVEDDVAHERPAVGNRR
jgi:hypothetical protein